MPIISLTDQSIHLHENRTIVYNGSMPSFCDKQMSGSYISPAAAPKAAAARNPAAASTLCFESGRIAR